MSSAFTLEGFDPVALGILDEVEKALAAPPVSVLLFTMKFACRLFSSASRLSPLFV
jgi:hypothetical protein